MTRFKRNLLEESDLDPRCLIKRRYKGSTCMFVAKLEHVNILSDFINLTQVHNFTVSAHDIFTFRRLSVFTVSFTRILQVLMQIMKRFPLYY